MRGMCHTVAPTPGPGDLSPVHETADLLTSTTDPLSQGIVAATLLLLFVLLTMEKAHRVLVAMVAVSVVWAIT